MNARTKKFSLIAVLVAIGLIIWGIVTASAANATIWPGPDYTEEELRIRAEQAKIRDAFVATDETCGEFWTDTVLTHDAVPADYDSVLVSEAGWQRYSWTGGPHTADAAPAFPSENWQANTQSDPHGVGVEGAYFVSAGNSGNGDWFYLELIPAVYEDVLVSEAVPGWSETIRTHFLFPPCEWRDGIPGVTTVVAPAAAAAQTATPAAQPARVVQAQPTFTG